MTKAISLVVLVLFSFALFFTTGCWTTSPSSFRVKSYGSIHSKPTLEPMDNGGAFSVMTLNIGTNKSKSPVLSPSVTNAARATVFVTNEEPRLSPGLVVSVSVLVAGQKEIDEPAKRVSNAGEITLPLIGHIQVNGLSLDDLAAKLTKIYNVYYVQPQVVIEFAADKISDGSSSPWGYVTVLGRVKNPGRVSIPPTQDMTVSGAIQNVGGLDTSAKDSAIKVTRQLPDGKFAQYEVDLRSVGTRGRVNDDIILKPNDIIFVPEMIF